MPPDTVRAVATPQQVVCVRINKLAAMTQQGWVAGEGWKPQPDRHCRDKQGIPWSSRRFPQVETRALYLAGLKPAISPQWGDLGAQFVVGGGRHLTAYLTFGRRTMRCGPCSSPSKGFDYQALLWRQQPGVEFQCTNRATCRAAGVMRWDSACAPIA